MTVTTASAYRPFGAFRFLLAGMVVVSHLHVLAGSGSVLSPLGLGNMGVMSFFILSGYVIAEAIALFYDGRPGAFLINRLLRIFPPYLVALLIAVLVHLLLARYHELKFFDAIAAPERIFERSNLIGNALSLAVPFGLGRLGIGVEYPFVRYSWAVAIELLFYYVMAGLVLLSLQRPLRALRPVVYWAAAAAVGFAAFLLAMSTKLGYYQLSWIPYFMLGVALYHCSVPGTQRALAVSVSILALICVNWQAFDYVSRNPAAHSLAAVAILDVLIVAMWVLSRMRVGGSMMRADQFLGDLTYPIYLNHYAVGIAFISVMPERNFSIQIFCAGLVAVIACSYLAMQLSEPFTRRLRERIRGRRL